MTIFNRLKRTFAELNLDLNWDNTLSFNIKDKVENIKFGDTTIHVSNSIKFLGIHIGKDLSWKTQLQVS